MSCFLKVKNIRFEKATRDQGLFVITVRNDGVSTRNLGPIFFCWVLRNDQGHMLRMYYGYLGVDNNNVVELKYLAQGLKITINNVYCQVIAEGDSQVCLVVHIETRLQSGISIYQSTCKKYKHVSSQTLLILISDISLVKCHLADFCYQLYPLKCRDDQFHPSLSILCMISSTFTTSMTIIGVIKGEVDKILEFHERRAR